MGAISSTDVKVKNYLRHLDYYILNFDLTSEWNYFYEFLGCEFGKYDDVDLINMSIQKIILSDVPIYYAEVRFYQKVNFELESWSREIAVNEENIIEIIRVLSKKNIKCILEKRSYKTMLRKGLGSKLF